MSAFDTNILLTGGDDTQRILVAHEIHRSSRRQDGPFVVINARDITDQALKDCLGAAVNGALVIQGVEQISNEAQAVLFRTTEQAMAGNVRLMTTTCGELFDLVQTGRFCSDLFYRLNQIRLVIPSPSIVASEVEELHSPKVEATMG